MFSDNRIKDLEYMTYDEWLKTQPISIQNLVIGVRRDHFVPLTLSEMKQKRPEVFEKANVDV